MSIFIKPINEISFSDINSLIKNKIRESYDLDYKSDYPDNKILAKLMISFSNATGGYIIIGVEEEKVNNQNTGIPKEIVGVDRGDHSTKITQIALSHTQPKIFPKIAVINHEEQNQKEIVVIRIDEAIEPIMYYHANDSNSHKFFIRINDKNEPADQVLLKKLFSRRPFFEELKHLESEIYHEQSVKFDDYFRPEVVNNYIFFGLVLLPYNNNFDLIDTNDKEVEIFLKDLYLKLAHGSPSGELRGFYNFIKNLSYNGNSYKSFYRLSNKNRFNEAEFNIYTNGNIIGNIIYKARSAKELILNSHKEYDESREEKYNHSPFLYSKILPYLIIMFLIFSKFIFIDRFEGRFKSIIRIISTNKISLDIYEFLALSSSDDFKIEKTFYFYALKNSENFKELINSILKEFLRYFGYDLKNVDKYLEKFQDIIDKYIT